MSEVSERRRFAREWRTIYAWLDFPTSSGESAATRATTTVDLCEQGARFSGVEVVHPGTPVITHLQIGFGHGVIECKGKVIWSAVGPRGLYDFGVRFVDLSDEERAILGHTIIDPRGKLAAV